MNLKAFNILIAFLICLFLIPRLMAQPFTVSGGSTLSVSADSDLGPVADALTLDDGTLQTSAGINFALQRGLVLNAGNGTIDTNSYTSSWNGVVSGVGNLSVTGGGPYP